MRRGCIKSLKNKKEVLVGIQVSEHFTKKVFKVRVFKIYA